MLDPAIKSQQRSMRQVQAFGWFTRAAAMAEPTWRAEADRCNLRLRFTFIITMPTHVMITVVVTIKEDKV